MTEFSLNEWCIMRVRSKPPSLVSMWMLDVFCCALGCVTLLWLLNTQKANEQAESLGQTGLDLVQTRLEREEAEHQAAVLAEQKDEQILRLVGEIADLRQTLRATDLRLANANVRLADSESQLRKKELDLAALTKENATALEKVLTLEKLLRDNEKLRTELALRAKDLTERLDDLDAKYKSLQLRSNESMAKSDSLRDELAKAQARIRSLETESAQQKKQLDQANVSIIDLQGEKKRLADKVDQLQRESENRFAGIAMTGKRVVFLIDMSGSMGYVDRSTQDLTKWPKIAETLVKVMRSLPELTEFQVILFSTDVSFPLGEAGNWIPYQGEATVARVQRRLLEIRPNGDTNMYAGLQAAFRYRDKGLDTVYLFSDGLPNTGPGLEPGDAKKSEVERTEILSRYIRVRLKTDWNRPTATQSRVKINSIGFFYESPDVGAFLWALSRENDGSFVGMSKP